MLYYARRLIESYVHSHVYPRFCPLESKGHFLKIFYKDFVETQFKYCPHIWMFHSRYTINKINALLKRELRIVCDDYVPNFDQLLEKDHTLCIHHQNIHGLIIAVHRRQSQMRSQMFNKRNKKEKSCQIKQFQYKCLNNHNYIGKVKIVIIKAHHNNPSGDHIFYKKHRWLVIIADLTLEVLDVGHDNPRCSGLLDYGGSD